MTTRDRQADRRARLTRASRLVPLIALGIVAACGTQNLDYIQDDRVTIDSPRGDDETTLPVRVSWSVRDFDGGFAVFFDRAPMKPGQDVRSLVPDDDRLCRQDPSCPDAEWLASRGIYVTSETHLTVDSLADRRASSRQKDRHEVVIVLLDHEGRRIRESAFIREFFVDRQEA